MKTWRISLCLTLGLLAAGAAWATGIMVPTDESVPPLAVKYHRIGTVITDGVATTKVEQAFINSTGRPLEANFVFPLPKDAAVKEFAMYINGKRTTAELVEAPKARKIYEDIVRRARDPALLEFMGNQLFRMRVFPIPAKGEQRVELEYSQTLEYDAGLYKYVYPLKIGERYASTLEDLALSATVRSKVPITTVYSPSHTIGIDRQGEHEAVVGFEQERAPLNKDFVLYYGVSEKNFGLNMLANKPAGEDGFFMLMISPSTAVEDAQIVKKDVVFVFDTSGSMSGEKIEQARRALTFCVNSLNEGDAFNIVQFATTVNTYKPAMVAVADESIQAAREFIAGLDATGGTDINAALTTALAMRPRDGTRPFMIIFLTDGKPTLGETIHENIIKNVAAANTDAVRIFIFGVGHHVNTHLLDRLAQTSRGVTEYVEPTEDIEVKVSNFFAKASHPVLANVKLAFGETIRAYDLYPREMPDLFKGVPLQVFGRWSGSGDVAVTLSGEVNGEKRSFTYETTFPEKHDENEFIARLWATRRVGYLLDEIRLHGENDELVDSVTTLAKEYGIVTPYTSYLIVEDQPLRPTGGERTAGRWHHGRGDRDRSPRESTGTELAVDVMDAWSRKPKGGSSTSGPSLNREMKPDDAGTSAEGNDEEPALMPDVNKIEIPRSRESIAYRGGNGPAGGFAKEALELEEGEVAVRAARGIEALKRRNSTGPEDRYASAIRNVGKRNFYRLGDYWVDATVQPHMPVLRVKYGSTAYFSLLEWRPDLKKFLAIGEKLALVVEGHLILIGDEGEETLTKEAFETFLAAKPEEAGAAQEE